jgi:hypothetical protein
VCVLLSVGGKGDANLQALGGSGHWTEGGPRLVLHAGTAAPEVVAPWGAASGGRRKTRPAADDGARAVREHSLRMSALPDDDRIRRASPRLAAAARLPGDEVAATIDDVVALGRRLRAGVEREM